MPAKKTTAKKTPAKKTTTKKTTAKKVVTKKTTKVAATKKVVKKTTAKKTPSKKITKKTVKKTLKLADKIVKDEIAKDGDATVDEINDAMEEVLSRDLSEELGEMEKKGDLLGVSDLEDDYVASKSKKHDSVQMYLKEIGKHDLINAAKEIELAKRIEAGDDSAKQELAKANLRLVVSIAKNTLDDRQT